MKYLLTILASAALLVPASSALAGSHSGHPQKHEKQAKQKQAKQKQASKAKAYGKYCRTQSRKHVKGEKGTPFSRCVTGVARVRKNDN